MSGLTKLLKLWSMIPKGPQMIDGIPVGVDNAAYVSGGKADSYVEDPNFFLTPPLDTGDTTSKQITFYRYNAATVGGKAASARFFNDLSASNVDFYSASATSPGPRTVTIAAQCPKPMRQIATCTTPWAVKSIILLRATMSLIKED